MLDAVKRKHVWNRSHDVGTSLINAVSLSLTCQCPNRRGQRDETFLHHRNMLDFSRTYGILKILKLWIVCYQPLNFFLYFAMIKRHFLLQRWSRVKSRAAAGEPGERSAASTSIGLVMSVCLSVCLLSVCLIGNTQAEFFLEKLAKYPLFFEFF